MEIKSGSEEGLWCVVASETPKFRGGTKVYIAGCYAGMCDSVVAIGLHRKSRRFITCVIKVKHVEQFRAKLVYHPKVIELIKHDLRCWFRTKGDADQYAAAFLEWQRQ